MLNELRKSDIFSSKIAITFVTPLIIVLSSFSGFVGLKLAFFTCHWNQQWANRKKIPLSFLHSSCNAKRASLPLPSLTWHHSVKGRRVSVLHCSKLWRWSRESPRWTSSVLREAESKFSRCQSSYFSSTSDIFFLKYGIKKEKVTSLSIQQTSVFYAVLSITACSLLIFSMKQRWLVGCGAAKAREARNKEKCNKESTAREQQDLNDSISHSGENLT